MLSGRQTGGSGAWGLLGSGGSLPFRAVSTHRPAPGDFTVLLTPVTSLKEEPHQRSLGTTGSQQKVRQDFSERRDQSGRWSSHCSSPLSGSRKRMGAGTRTARCSPQSRGVGGPQTHTCDLANTTIQQSGSRVCDAPSCSPAPLTATLRPLPPGRLASHPCRLILCPTVWALGFCAPVSRGPVGPAPSGGNCSRESSATAHQERIHLTPAPSSQPGEGVSGSFSRRATARR